MAGFIGYPWLQYLQSAFNAVQMYYAMKHNRRARIEGPEADFIKKNLDINVTS